MFTHREPFSRLHQGAPEAIVALGSSSACVRQEPLTDLRTGH